MLVCFHFTLLPFPLLLANVASCSVGKGVYRCRKEIDRLIGLKSDTFLITYRTVKMTTVLWRVLRSNSGPRDKFRSSNHGYRVSYLSRPTTCSFMIKNESVRPDIRIHAVNMLSRGDTKQDDLFLVFLISRFIRAHRVSG